MLRLFLIYVYPLWAAGEPQIPMQQHPSCEQIEWEINTEGYFMFMCWCRFPEVIAVIVETELGFFCLWRFQMNTLQFIFK